MSKFPWDWICEYCYRTINGRLPDSWEFVWQSAICPECWSRCQDDGGIAVVLGGQYADADDPRAEAQS